MLPRHPTKKLSIQSNQRDCRKHRRVHYLILLLLTCCPASRLMTSLAVAAAKATQQSEEEGKGIVSVITGLPPP